MTTGDTLGPYRILGELGIGGMGEVYRARDAQLNRDVAIKILPDAFAHDAERVARFTREAQTLASLNHPNIAQIFGIVETPAAAADAGAGASHVHGLVMELVEGEDLAALIGRGPMPLADALPIAKQIADALEAAHEQGIIHRDLKPANIRIRPDGTVKVLDFGLARTFDPTSNSGANAMNSPTMISPASATQMGMILGTAAYMSPEQARGRAVDRRADIWAFGVVLFEMLTGHRAFPGDDISDVLASVLKSDPAWNEVPATCPPSVRRVLRRCLEKDPRHRLSAIGDARLDLDEREPIGSSSPPRRPSGWSWLALLAGATALVAITAFAVARINPASAAGVPKRLSIMAPQAGALYPDSRESTISPDGRLVAFVTGSPSGLESTELWIRALDAVSARRVEGIAGAHLPFWSPDSRRVGFFANGKLETVGVEGGRVTVLCDAPDGRGATWGAGGVIVFAANSAGPLFRVAADGGEPSAVTTLDGGRKETGHRFPFFLPDGKHFVFATLPAVNGLFDIFVGSVDGFERTRLLSADSAPVYSATGHLLYSRKGTIVLQAFDASRLRLTSDPTVLEDAPGGIGLQYSAGPALSVSAGALVYLRDPFVDTRLVWVDREGRELGTVDAARARYTEIRLAPDNQRVAVVRAASAQQSAVWVLDLVRRGATRIAETQHLNYFVSWSPDGKQLVYTNDDSGTETLFVRDAGAALPTKPFYSSSVLFKKSQCWSPDGKVLLFTQRTPDTQNDLMTVSTSGERTATPFLNESFNEDGGRFSPDGRWVAYFSDEAGTNDVYVRSFPRPDRKYRVTTDGGTWVTWKRDGTALLIAGADGHQLKMADVRAGPELSIAVPRVVGHLPADTVAWDSAGDLQRLLVSVPGEGNPGLSLTVVVDWLSLLRKR